MIDASGSKQKPATSKSVLAKWMCKGCSTTISYSGKLGVTKRYLKMCPNCKKWVFVYDYQQGLSQFIVKEEMKPN